MRNPEAFKGKRVTIIGLARSGLACANLLHGLGAQVSITDNQDSEAARANAAKLVSADIRRELGRHSPEFIKGSDMVVVSPGVPDTSEAVRLAKQYGIPVVSEVEVAWSLCPAALIAVTGSNGKTTVTTLIGRILEQSGKRVYVCGNIGTPFCQEVARMQHGDFVVLEISSFQLEKITTFKPHIAVIINVTCNHLDRHKDMQEYLDAKKRIFMNQDASDYLVLNKSDKVLQGIAREAKSRVVFFEQTNDLNPNQAAVVAVGSLVGIDEAACRKVFSDFRGIEHRLEFVTEINRVKFINDSKATTVESALWALRSISQPIILIAGGRHKGIDYSLMRPAVSEKVKALVLIGEATTIIRDSLAGSVAIEEAASLEEAVAKAFAKAVSGDCILLSPMCSSYDMFSNYEERGKRFKEIVRSLKS